MEESWLGRSLKHLLYSISSSKRRKAQINRVMSGRGGVLQFSEKRKIL